MASNKPIKFSSIPRNNVNKAVSALSAIAETLTGAKGNGLEKAVTFRDLEKLELVTVKRSINGGDIIFDPIEPGDGDDETAITPLRPTNFSATGGFTSILLRWDFPTYAGHSYTEVWRSENNILGEAAKLVDTNSLNYSDIPGNNFSGYYWARHVNVNGEKGPFHDTSGEFAQTAEDIEFNIDVLNGRISEIHLNSYLSDNFDLIQINNDAVADLVLLVNENKSLADNAIDTINDTTIPAVNAYVDQVAAAIDTRVVSIENTVIPSINQQIADIGALFPDYATLSYANSTFLDQTDVDSAISGRLDTFLSSVIQPNYTTQAYLTSLYLTEADTNTAISQQIDTHYSTIIQPNFVTTALLTSDYRTEANTDAAIAQAITTFYSNTISPNFVSNAFLETNYLTETDVNGAISSIEESLRAEFTSGNVTSAYLENNYRTEANTDIAIAQAVQVLRSEVDGDDYATNATLINDYRTESDTDSAISQALSTFLTGTITPTFATTSFLQNNYLTESSTNSAISSALSEFLASTISPNYATNAFISTNYISEADTQTAISSSLSNFLATVIAPDYATSAFITNNYRTETNTDTAISTQVSGLRSEIFDGAGVQLQSAFVSNLDSAIANSTGSIATSLSGLSATINDPATGLAATAATVSNNYQAVVNDTGDIISSHIAAYSVTANGVTNTLSQWAEVAADADANFIAQWGFKATVGELTGGVGFVNNGSVVQFVVSADRFGIIDPRNDEVKSLLTTVTNDPVLPDGVYIDAAFIRVANISEIVAGDINADTVTAGIGIESPSITGGDITGSQVTVQAGSYKLDIVPGSSIPLWFGLTSSSRNITNSRFALGSDGKAYARGLQLKNDSGVVILDSDGEINGAFIENLSVGTLDIEGNAVVLPYAIETTSTTVDTRNVGQSYQTLMDLTYDAGVPAMMVYFLVVQVRLTVENTSQVDKFTLKVELRNNGTLEKTTTHSDIPIDLLDTTVNQLVYLPLTASHYFSSNSVGIKLQIKGSNNNQVLVSKITGTVQSAKR